MKVALMWTINDFYVNEMVSGWNMHEQLIFPYYMENNKAFALTNSGKMSLFFLLPPTILAKITSTERT
jgi:hypothetical protein